MILLMIGQATYVAKCGIAFCADVTVFKESMVIQDSFTTKCASTLFALMGDLNTVCSYFVVDEPLSDILYMLEMLSHLYVLLPLDHQPQPVSLSADHPHPFHYFHPCLCY